VLHQDGASTGRVAEDQANRFASAFLMPHADVLAVIPRVVHLGQIVKAKSRWRVSVTALTYRLHKIGMMTDWKYRDLCIEISTKGYHREEPIPIERERSVVWQKVLRALWVEKTTQAHIARDLCLPEEEVNGLIFGVAGEIHDRPSAPAPLSIVTN
jgi:Zn-dependent peptidase ImmA (M78 family)